MAVSTVEGSRLATVAGAEQTTLPLWIYVFAFPQPAATRIATRSVIGNLFLPPTLMPRRSTTWVEGVFAGTFEFPVPTTCSSARSGGRRPRQSLHTSEDARKGASRQPLRPPGC